ncbi:MAG: right-handed parallel beta-helix repeat-containing protein, partial [Desulfamplus sp.]|nr:right-handed parallel beta-helix repeat-containing protein [Desulfamplus sp.]
LNGDASKVIVKGKGMNGNVPHVFSVYKKYFTVEDITIGWVRNHGIQVHGELDADYPVIRNVHFRDTYEQMLKVSYSKTQPDFSDGGIVENCSFIYTAGVGPQWYIGGVDAHKSKGWIVRNNLFQDIKSPTSSMSESAIHFWSGSTDTLVEKNVIIDCDRGIMFGLDNSPHYGGIIRNNFVHATRDVGIYAASTLDAKIYNNTVFIDSTYFNAIEYRFADTNIDISNNLTNKAISKRDNARATLSNNVDYAAETWFEDVRNGDLHLKEAIYAVIDQGIDINGLTHDIDGDIRQSGKVDIGADEAQFEIKTISSLEVEPDKTVILSNGRDQVVLKVKATYQDNSLAYINADKIVAKDSNGKERILTSNIFQSFVTGTYKIYATSQDATSPEVAITVENEDLAQAQPSNIGMLHRAGQTFIVFDEIVQIVDRASIFYDELYTLVKSYPRNIQYRIYRSQEPITSQNITALVPVGTVNSLSGWNLELYGTGTSSKHQPAMRYVIAEGSSAITPLTNPPNPTATSATTGPINHAGTPLDLDQGLFVYSPSVGGASWYAVTSVVDGVENRTVTDGVNTAYISGESVGQGEPVLQRIEFDNSFQYIANVELYIYTRWEAPPNCSVMGKPYDYLVGRPQNMASPAPVGIHMHCWGGDLYGGYGWWNDAEDGALILSSNQFPYDWWTGYHEKLYTFKGQSYTWGQSLYQSGVVKPYTTNRLVSFLDWMQESGNWNIDRSRTFTAGSSMGGSGSLMMAIRYPELISWSRSWVGVHVPEKSPNFKSSYQIVYGKPEYGVLFKKDDSDPGTPVWDYYNDAWYLKNHVDKSIGFLSFSNGKNDGAIGWEQAVDFINALQETRQPHLFIWGQSGHSQRTVFPKNGSERHMEIDIKLNQSLPAFTRCSLDNNYGNGQSSDGDASGQVNRYLYWQTHDLIETASTWQISVALMNTAPADACLVDITPRRLQSLSLAPGQVINFTNTDNTTAAVVGSGQVIADKYGLITIEQTKVSKGGNRITISL